MNVSELIELLQDADPNAEVRIATQPTYPLAFTVAGVAAGQEEETTDYVCGLPAGVVWLAAGDSPYDSPYAPSGVFENARRW